MAMMSYVHKVHTVYDLVQDPQMVLLSEKEAHGVSVRRENLHAVASKEPGRYTRKPYAFHCQ